MESPYPQSRQRLERLFWNAVGNCPTPRETGRNNGLQQEMERQTAHRLQDSLTSLKSALFSITPGQWHTLKKAGITPAQQELLAGLNHLAKPRHDYAATGLLEVIATTPENPEEWPQWWTINSGRSVATYLARGNRHPERHDLAQLKAVIARMAAAAAPALPSPDEAAAAPQPPETLSEALDRTSRVGELAYAMGLEAAAADYARLTPEELSRQLADAGLDCRPNIGTLRPPEELRHSAGFPGPDGFRCDLGLDLWWTEGAAPPGGIYYLIPNEYRPQPGAESGEEEARLIRRTAARIPEGRSDGLGAYAQRYGLTPDEARRALLGEPPGESVKKPCPLADECQARCGAAHRAGTIQFPPTPSGSPEECDYYVFLMTHRGQPGREPAAKALNVRLDRRKQRREPTASVKESNGPEPAADRPPQPKQMEIGW